VIFVFPGFAVSIEVADLVNKATLKEAEYEKLIGDYIKVETLESAVEPKLAKTISYGKGVKTRSDIGLINKGKKISSVSIYDGKYKWTINATMKMKTPQEPAGQLSDNLKSRRSLDLLGKNFKIEKTEKANGRNCYVISAVLPEKAADGGKLLMWIDKENYNTYTQLYLDKNGKEATRTVFSNFRIICDGVIVPFRTDIFVKGKLISHVIVNSYKVNQKLSDDIFDASKFKVPELDSVMKNMKERREALEKIKNNN
jgi:outer membrane lipoprotein-sorting protein